MVLAKNPERAAQALQLTGDVLADLSLKLHPAKTRIISFEQGFDFLGWRFVRSVAVPIRKTSISPVRNADDASIQSVRIELFDMPTIPKDFSMPNSRDLPDALELALHEALAENPDWQPAPAMPQTVRTVPVEVTLQSIEAPSLNQGESGESELPGVDIADNQQSDHLPSLQRTLYLLDAACQLGCDNQRLVVRKKSADKVNDTVEVVLTLPIHAVDQVMLFGTVQASTAALHLCMGAGVNVAYLSKMGRFRGLAAGVSAGEAASSVAMLRAQVLVDSSSNFKVDMARHFIHAKLHNSLLLLKRYARRRHDSTSVQTHLQIADQIGRLKTITNAQSLLGIEGSTASAYFSAWREWLPPEWRFGKRAKQPPPDPVNALLSFGYSVLYHATAGLLQARGLDARLGLMHTEGGTHMALASDLMEGFRAVIVDAVVLNLCLNRLSPIDFTITPDGCTIKPEIIKLFIHALEDKLNTPIKHPDTGEQMDFRRLIDSQVLQLQRAIRAQDARLFTPLLLK